MKYCFMDIGGLDYHANTPLEAPLGGSESAVVYLARTLAYRGHEVTLLNRTSKPGTYGQVRCISMADLEKNHFQTAQYDAVIHVNYAEALPSLRQELPPQTRLVHWHHHNHESETTQAICRPEVQAACDLFVFVSAWQAREIIRLAQLPREKCTYRHNAIGFSFRDLFKDVGDIGRAKQGVPKLAYASVPGRGLHVLLDIFPPLKKRFNSLELHVFSSLEVYQASEAEEAEMQEIYETCRTMPGVHYHGSLSQPKLADALTKMHFLAYPSTFLETSSITVMEAMAAGLYIVSSNYGALPETTRNYADLIEVTPSVTYGIRYQEALRLAIESWIKAPLETLENLSQQVLDINLKNTWQAKGWEWASILYQVCKKQKTPVS